MQYLITYLAIMNASGFLLMLADKHRAVKKKWRIPERAILSTCAVGGSLGVLLGMYLFRHKTRHPQFAIGIPVLLVLQIVGLVLWYGNET